MAKYKEYCSFCAKKNEVLFKGVRVSICSFCIKIANELVTQLELGKSVKEAWEITQQKFAKTIKELKEKNEQHC